VADTLALSLWLRAFRQEDALRHFEELVRVFPFSHLRPGVSAVRIYAFEFSEPPAMEQGFAGETDVESVIGLCREFENSDCAYVVDGWWDLWRYDDGWKLAPSKVSLICFGPEFDNAERDHLRIELGSELNYLPNPGAPENLRALHSNLQSVLRLSREMGESLPVEREKLWTETDENFAERLEEELDGVE